MARMREADRESAGASISRSSSASPIARWLQRAEIGALIVWVSSDKAATVNGALLGVDAGM